jgi:hypothetical protein
MASKNFTAPRLPAAPVEYSQQFMDQLTNILRLYFAQLDNASPMLAASQNVGAANVVSALTFAQPDPANPGQFTISLPTQADLANLRSGDVYVDTSASNALKVKV